MFRRFAARLGEALRAILRPKKLARVPVTVRSRMSWLALAALPLIVAACNNAGGGNGY
jgi:energy-coupling factor transporter transmembrane protein EcfT